VDRIVWLAALSSAPADVLQDDILSAVCDDWYWNEWTLMVDVKVAVFFIQENSYIIYYCQ